MNKTLFPLCLACVLATTGCKDKGSDFQASFQRFVPWETETATELMDADQVAEEFVESSLQAAPAERDYSYDSGNRESSNSYEQSLRDAEDRSYSEIYKEKREARRAYDTGEAYRSSSTSDDEEWEHSGGYSQEQENISHVIDDE